VLLVNFVGFKCRAAEEFPTAATGGFEMNHAFRIELERQAEEIADAVVKQVEAAVCGDRILAEAVREAVDGSLEHMIENWE
jgi:hypothetical protein